MSDSYAKGLLDGVLFVLVMILIAAEANIPVEVHGWGDTSSKITLMFLIWAMVRLVLWIAPSQQKG